MWPIQPERPATVQVFVECHKIWQNFPVSFKINVWCQVNFGEFFKVLKHMNFNGNQTN